MSNTKIERRNVGMGDEREYTIVVWIKGPDTTRAYRDLIADLNRIVAYNSGRAFHFEGVQSGVVMPAKSGFQLMFSSRENWEAAKIKVLERFCDYKPGGLVNWHRGMVSENGNVTLEDDDQQVFNKDPCVCDEKLN